MYVLSNKTALKKFSQIEYIHLVLHCQREVISCRLWKVNFRKCHARTNCCSLTTRKKLDWKNNCCTYNNDANLNWKYISFSIEIQWVFNVSLPIYLKRKLFQGKRLFLMTKEKIFPSNMKYSQIERH